MVRAFICPECHAFAAFESNRCTSCGGPLGLCLATRSMVLLDDDAAVVDGKQWVRCTQAGPLGCNWLVPAEADPAARGRCLSDTLDTSREAGMVLHADRVRFNAPRDIAPRESYADASIEELLADWKWVSMFFNRVNTAMGKNPLYPFEIGNAVAEKLGFVHKVVKEVPL